MTARDKDTAAEGFMRVTKWGEKKEKNLLFFPLNGSKVKKESFFSKDF